MNSYVNLKTHNLNYLLCYKEAYIHNKFISESVYLLVHSLATIGLG